ncbi:hypothetical protein EDD21DRAFT_333733 [Dissophora ornata]|nr:hypothetical protein EDD21DRAFT_333733 [Dissophora ornata]
MSPEHHRLHASPTYTSKPVRHASLQDQIRAERPRDPRRPSSIIQSVIENPEPHYYHHHHDDGASGSRRHHAAVMFPKIFTKEGVRNALFLNSAATAFTKSTRSKDLCNVNIPVASLAITGSAVPALWLRRDDKGRRPPPVLFQMLQIAVSDSELEMGVSKQLVFRVELQYGDVKWVIRRTLYDFYRLHLILTTKRFVNLPKFPNQLSYAFSMAKATLGMRSEEKANYLRQTNLTRRHALQTYLLQVMMQLNWTIAYDLYEFLEISAMSLTKDMGWKGKEAYVETKITDSTISNICSANGFSRWEKNWALLRDSYMAFCPTVGSDEPTDVFIFDQTFFVQHKEQTLGLNMHHIELGNSHRKIEIKGEHNREMLEWMDHFTKMKQSSPWVHSHRFGSFAPEREEAKVRYYVDGKDYFHAVSDAILAAKTEIYICDWWLSPELYLRRPSELNEDFRIDRLLKRKAMEGVMIYIVVYKEIALALTLDSAHTKIWLQDLHPNIQVQRHPDHLTVNATQFWAHHEKICVIDCRLAFIGGLDLCFGRYDSRTHQLSDYHPSGNGTIWPGLDYSNPRIKDFVNVKDYNSDLIEKKLLARMPWHDVSVGVAGQPARDIARHFVQRWNFVKREKGMKKSKAHMKFLTPKGEFSSTRNESGWTGTQKVQILRSSTLWSQGVDMERSIQDAYLSSIEKAEHFIYVENQFFVTLAVENGNPDIKNKIGIALVNRILRAYQEGKKFRVIVVMPLMPAFEADIMSSEAGTLRKVMHFQYQSICRGGNSVVERLIAFGVDPSRYIGFFGLRSFDRTGEGNPPMAEEVQENSGYGYETVEEEERRSIRETESINEPGPWESDSPGSGSGGNNVGVGVVAADGGDKTTSDSNATANPAELPRADEPGPIKVEKPIVDNELDDFVTEQLYIHSKLMIVDDRIIICGSANINDRSQLGFRDSEIAIIIEDTDMISTRMNGMPYQAGKLAHSLRSDLFKEHLGLLPHVEHDVVTKASVLPRAAADDPRAADEIVADPLHDDFYENWWRRVAATNTEIFREVFRCVPDDTVETWDDYRNFVPNPKKVLTGHVAMEGATVDNVTERLKKVSGHLVEFPMNFLNKENLLGGAVEGAVVPMEIFT